MPLRAIESLPPPEATSARPALDGEVDAYALLCRQLRGLERILDSLDAAAKVPGVQPLELAQEQMRVARAMAPIAQQMRAYEQMRFEQAEEMDFTGSAEVLERWFAMLPPERARELYRRLGVIVSRGVA